MRETWYMLEDGTVADPNNIAPDDDGTLRHTSGVAVAMKGSVPHSIGVDPAAERAKDIKPDAPKRIYKTREAKAA